MATTAAVAAASTATSDVTAAATAVGPVATAATIADATASSAPTSPAGTATIHIAATPAATTADAGTSTDMVAGPEVVQCDGITAKGGRCKVCSVGSSAPDFISAPLQKGARYCVTHRIIAKWHQCNGIHRDQQPP